MKQLLSAPLVKSSLNSHSWLGLAIGIFMYLICLSGTLVVLYPELERWEQPTAAEFVEYDPVILDRAFANVVNQGSEITHHMYLSMPTEEMPRATISSDNEGWFINADGSLGEPVAHDFTHVLINLHNYLHLPASFGMIIVSIMGALLCGLIVSGVLSHPSIFRDAFSFRRQGSARLEQVDLHNRLSVWGLPFHLMIAITGAWFGLSSLFALVAAEQYFDGDTTQIIESIYGAEPDLQQEIEMPALGRAVATLQEMDPDRPPFYLTLEEADKPEKQWMIIGTRHYDRLIYAEQHRLDGAGNYLDKVGFSDGEAGRQAIFSVYRLHFGHFGNWAVKLAYILLGLALTIISVSGINIWLERRKTRDALNHLWTGMVWGAPAAIALVALLGVLVGAASALVFWCAVLAAMACCQIVKDDGKVKSLLLGLTSVLLFGIVITHGAKYGAAAFGPAASMINILLFITAIIFMWMSWAGRKKGAD